MAVRVLGVEVAILGSELTSLDLFVTELFYTSYKPPSPCVDSPLPADRPTKKALRAQSARRRNTVYNFSLTNDCFFHCLLSDVSIEA